MTTSFETTQPANPALDAVLRHMGAVPLAPTEGIELALPFLDAARIADEKLAAYIKDHPSSGASSFQSDDTLLDLIHDAQTTRGEARFTLPSDYSFSARIQASDHLIVPQLRGRPPLRDTERYTPEDRYPVGELTGLDGTGAIFGYNATSLYSKEGVMSLPRLCIAGMMIIAETTNKEGGVSGRYAQLGISTPITPDSVQIVPTPSTEVIQATRDRIFGWLATQIEMEPYGA